MDATEEIKERIERISREIGLIWKVYDKFLFAYKNFMEYSENFPAIDNNIPLWIHQAFAETIIIRLRRFLLDRDARTKSLLASLGKIKEYEEYRTILEGNPESFKSEILELYSQESKNFLNETQKIVNNIQEKEQNGDINYETFLSNLEELDKKIIEFIQKTEKIENQKTEKIEKEPNKENKIIESTESFLNDLKESSKKIEEFYQKIKPTETDPSKTYKNAINALKDLVVENGKIAIEKLKIPEKIEEFCKKIEVWLIFYKTRIIVDKFIAHSEEPKDLLKSLETPHSQFLYAIDYIVEKVGGIVGMGIETTVPITMNVNEPLTAFMIPWLRPAYGESQKTETITDVNKYELERHLRCEITLDNSVFCVYNFPSNYEWEKGNEVAIFWSYNYQNPKEAYVICNFSKKQWCKGMLYMYNGTPSNSWILPEKEKKLSLEKLQSKETTQDIVADLCK